MAPPVHRLIYRGIQQLRVQAGRGGGGTGTQHRGRTCTQKSQQFIALQPHHLEGKGKRERKLPLSGDDRAHPYLESRAEVGGVVGVVVVIVPNFLIMLSACLLALGHLK